MQNHLIKVLRKEIKWVYEKFPELEGCLPVEFSTMNYTVMGGWQEVQQRISEFQEDNVFGDYRDLTITDFAGTITRIEAPEGYVYLTFSNKQGGHTLLLVPIQDEDDG